MFDKRKQVDLQVVRQRPEHRHARRIKRFDVDRVARSEHVLRHRDHVASGVKQKSLTGSGALFHFFARELGDGLLSLLGS